jgi:hypothetical protein
VRGRECKIFTRFALVLHLLLQLSKDKKHTIACMFLRERERERERERMRVLDRLGKQWWLCFFLIKGVVETISCKILIRVQNIVK